MNDTRSALTRGVARAFRLGQDAWMVIGITVLLVVALEVSYRVQAAAKSSALALIHPDPPTRLAPPNPFDSLPWAAAYRRDHESEEAVHWQPYVYVGNPTFTGTHITVDSLGHRSTPQSTSAAPSILNVFFLGGSTTFGWYQRNEHTMPAEAVRRLQRYIGDSVRVAATNFGVPGQTFTQEIIELMLQLRSGARPDVVVFYDGINDVLAAVFNNASGLPQNEANRVDDFVRGRDRAAEAKPGAAASLRVVRRISFEALQRLAFVQRILQVKHPVSPAEVSVDSLAAGTVRVYVANVELVEALAARYGFQPVFVWQPALLSSHKPLTTHEKWVYGKSRIGDLHTAIPRLLDSAMAASRNAHFIDATTLFDSDSLGIYVDTYGHTYERANTRVVDTLMTQLEAAVVRQASSKRTARAH